MHAVENEFIFSADSVLVIDELDVVNILCMALSKNGAFMSS